MALAEIGQLAESSVNKTPELTTAEKRLLLTAAIPGFSQWLENNLEEFEGHEGKYIRRIKICDLLNTVGYDDAREHVHYYWDMWKDPENKNAIRVQKSSGHALIITQDTAVEFIYGGILTKYPDNIKHLNPLQIAINFVHEVSSLQSQIAHSNKRVETINGILRITSQQKDGIIKSKTSEIAELKRINNDLEAQIAGYQEYLHNAGEIIDEQRVEIGQLKSANATKTEETVMEVKPRRSRKPRIKNNGDNPEELESEAVSDEFLKLSTEEETVFGYTENDGYSFDYISRKMEIPVNRVEHLWQSAQKKKDLLKEDGKASYAYLTDY